jgi:hypothetical protein
MFTANLSGAAGHLNGLPIRQAAFSRSLFEPACWTFDLILNEPGRDLARLAAIIEGGGVTVAATGPDGAPLTPPLSLAYPTIDRAAPGSHHLRVKAVARAEQTPRRRVIHATNLRDLVKAFSHLVETPTAVANVLSAVPLPDGRHACVVQDGADDATALRRVLVQHDALQREPALCGLILMGIAAPAGQPAWSLTWGGKAAFRHLGILAEQTMTLGDPGDVIDLDFGERAGGPTVRRSRYGLRFVAADWSAGISRQLPMFLRESGALVGAVEDRLYVTQAGTVGWDRHFETWPQDAIDPQPVAAAPSWIGKGIVEAWADDWLRVRLPGFEKAAEGDVLFAQHLTLSSGEDGEHGLHLLPEKGTTVLLFWSGWIGDPVGALNLRDRHARFDAPSLSLKKLLQLYLSEIEAKAAGKVRAESDGDWSVRSGGAIRHESKGPQTFKDAVGETSLENGIWKAGGA